MLASDWMLHRQMDFWHQEWHPLSTALYKDMYKDHIHCLECFDKITKQEILPNILVRLYNRGRYDIYHIILLLYYY